MDSPKISIVMPCYNRSDMLSLAIESCLNQDFKDFELIIVDDYSQDNSEAVALTFAKLDPRIRVITNPVNKKLPATLNVGFANAIGKYWTWTSDDNLFKPDALYRLNKFLDENLNIGLVYSDYHLINEEGSVGRYIYQEEPEFLSIRCCVGACFLYRAEVAKKNGDYNENLFLIEDYEYWLRMGLITKFAHIAESLYFYRVHKKSLTALRKKEIRLKKLELKNLFQNKYNIPKDLQPINNLYMWYIEDKTILSSLRFIKIILTNPITTLGYIFKNLRRIF